MKVSTFLLSLLFLFTAEVFAQQNTYTVKQGETLYSISKTLNVTVAELRQWNELSNNGISIGQELIYYKNDSQQTQVSQSDPGESLINTSAPRENVYYTVKSGDNLTLIARKHDMTVEELKELNNLSSDLLSIGQKLSVRKVKDSVGPSVSEFSEESEPQGSFVVYTIKSDESLSEILRKFKMSDRELQELNPGINISSLRTNQKITVLLPPSRSYPSPFLNKSGLQDLGSVGVDSYSENEAGNTTTNGELYNPEKLTAAHSNIALGSIIFIENPENNKGIYVRVNDRITDSGLKLSAKAFRILQLENSTNPTVTIFTDS